MFLEGRTHETAAERTPLQMKIVILSAAKNPVEGRAGVTLSGFSPDSSVLSAFSVVKVVVVRGLTPPLLPAPGSPPAAPQRQPLHQPETAQTASSTGRAAPPAAPAASAKTQTGR